MHRATVLVVLRDPVNTIERIRPSWRIAEVMPTETPVLPELAHYGNRLLYRTVGTTSLVRLAHRAAAPGTGGLMVGHVL
jgi:hypothetical protein